MVPRELAVPWSRAQHRSPHLFMAICRPWDVQATLALPASDTSTTSSCACNGKASPDGHGASCKAWGDTPDAWCHTDAACPSSIRSTSDPHLFRAACSPCPCAADGSPGSRCAQHGSSAGGAKGVSASALAVVPLRWCWLRNGAHETCPSAVRFGASLPQLYWAPCGNSRAELTRGPSRGAGGASACKCVDGSGRGIHTACSRWFASAAAQRNSADVGAPFCWTHHYCPLAQSTRKWGYVGRAWLECSRLSASIAMGGATKAGAAAFHGHDILLL